MSVEGIIAAIKLWKAVRPVRTVKGALERRRERRRERRETKAQRGPVRPEPIGREGASGGAVAAATTSKEEDVKKWHKSLTIQALIASGGAFVLGQYLGIADGDVASLTDRIVNWAIEGVQIGGIIVAAIGRKRASGPLAA